MQLWKTCWSRQLIRSTRVKIINDQDVKNGLWVGVLILRVCPVFNMHNLCVRHVNCSRVSIGLRFVLCSWHLIIYVFPWLFPFVLPILFDFGEGDGGGGGNTNICNGLWMFLFFNDFYRWFGAAVQCRNQFMWHIKRTVRQRRKIYTMPRIKLLFFFRSTLVIRPRFAEKWKAQYRFGVD